MDLLKYEQKYWNNGVSLIAGIDEAGRGPLSGPVVAAARVPLVTVAAGLSAVVPFGNTNCPDELTLN